MPAELHIYSKADATCLSDGAYSRLTDDDLRSIYRYLRTLPPYEHPTGPVMQSRE